MTMEELKAAVLALSPEEKKSFTLEVFPDLARNGMQDPSFLMQLLPQLMGLLQESGMDLQQLLQFASAFGGGSAANRPE